MVLYTHSIPANDDTELFCLESDIAGCDLSIPSSRPADAGDFFSQAETCVRPSLFPAARAASIEQRRASRNTATDADDASSWAREICIRFVLHSETTPCQV